MSVAWALRPDVMIVPSGTDQILFSRGGKVVRGPVGVPLAKLVCALENPHGAIEHQYVDEMVRASMVVPQGWSSSLDTADERLGLYFLGRCGTVDAAFESVRRVRSARVVMLGVGGVGSWILAGVSALGVEHVTIADCDVVDASNLNRTTVFTTADVGRPKAQAAVDWLRAAGRVDSAESYEVRIDANTDINHLLDPTPDLVLATLDENPWPAREVVARACISAAVPFLFVSGHTIGPLWCAPGDPCARCLGERKINNRTLASWAPLIEARGTKFGSVPGMAIASAGVAIDSVTDLLAFPEVRPQLHRSVWKSDGRGMGAWTEVLPASNCPGCGVGALHEPA